MFVKGYLKKTSKNHHLKELHELIGFIASTKMKSIRAFFETWTHWGLDSSVKKATLGRGRGEGRGAQGIGRGQGRAVTVTVTVTVNEAPDRRSAREEKKNQELKGEFCLGLRRKNSFLLRRTAKALRDNPTLAEKALWERLRRERLGAKFRRHAVLEGGIAPFWCPKKKLVVEIDRGAAVWKRLGLRAVSLTTHEIENSLPRAIKKIQTRLK